jgi:hypothetical protein
VKETHDEDRPYQNPNAPASLGQIFMVMYRTAAGVTELDLTVCPGFGMTARSVV